MVRSISYDEPNQDTYKYVKMGDKKFDSGDFVKDWYFSNKYSSEVIDEVGYIVNSSSVDHFIMDGDNYKSMYLKHLGDDNFSFTDEYNKESIEFFIPVGKEWTWEELKEYCKS